MAKQDDLGQTGVDPKTFVNVIERLAQEGIHGTVIRRLQRAQPDKRAGNEK